MNKYYIVSVRKYDEFYMGSTNDLEEAFQMARDEWDRISYWDRGKERIEVRKYTHDIEDEDCTCFDYDDYAWFEWYAVHEDDEDWDDSKGSFDLAEAVEMLKDYPDGHIAVVNCTDDYCIRLMDADDAAAELTRIQEGA